MTTPEQHLAELEQQEIEAWREYQLHAKESEELCFKWRRAYSVLSWARHEQRQAKQAPRVEV